MLKKAGIIVATAAAGVLALSPLAFAGEKHDSDKSKDHHATKVVENNRTEENISNDCEFGNTTGDTEQGVFGGSSLLGALGAVAGTVTNIPAQLNTLNCTNVNVEDVVDVNSNNESTEVQRTWIDESFNG